jgi:hypothetical protein
VAKQEIVWEHVLPSGRGVRFVRCSTRLLLDLTERAAEAAAPVPGMPVSQAKLMRRINEETVATCVRGITTRPLEMVYVDAREATDEEKAAGQKPPKAPDLEATFAKYRQEPGSRIWKSLGYASLTTDGDDHLLELFDDPLEFKAVLQRINASTIAQGGGATTDPFSGLPSTRSG